MVRLQNQMFWRKQSKYTKMYSIFSECAFKFKTIEFQQLYTSWVSVCVLIFCRHLIICLLVSEAVSMSMSASSGAQSSILI